MAFLSQEYGFGLLNCAIEILTFWDFNFIDETEGDQYLKYVLDLDTLLLLSPWR